MGTPKACTHWHASVYQHHPYQAAKTSIQITFGVWTEAVIVRYPSVAARALAQAPQAAHPLLDPNPWRLRLNTQNVVSQP